MKQPGIPKHQQKNATLPPRAEKISCIPRKTHVWRLKQHRARAQGPGRLFKPFIASCASGQELSSDPVCSQLPVAREPRHGGGKSNRPLKEGLPHRCQAPGGRGGDPVTSWGSRRPWEGKREKDSRTGVCLVFSAPALAEEAAKESPMNQETEPECPHNPHTLGQGHFKSPRWSGSPQGLGASVGLDPKTARDGEAP